MVTSRPSISTRPAIGSSSVAITRMVVVLPAPFGPMKPKISPCPTSKLTSRRTSSLAEAVPQVAHADGRPRCRSGARRGRRSRRRLLRPTTRTSSTSLSTRSPPSVFTPSPPFELAEHHGHVVRPPVGRGPRRGGHRRPQRGHLLAGPPEDRPEAPDVHRVHVRARADSPTRRPLGENSERPLVDSTVSPGGTDWNQVAPLFGAQTIALRSSWAGVVRDDHAAVALLADRDAAAEIRRAVLADDHRLPRQAGEVLERRALLVDAQHRRGARARVGRHHLEHAPWLARPHLHRARLAREEAAEPAHAAARSSRRRLRRATGGALDRSTPCPRGPPP